MLTTVTSQELSPDISGAQESGVPRACVHHASRPPCPCAADDGGLYRLTGGHMSLAEALAQPGAEFDFNPPRVGGGLSKPADLG